MQCLILAGGLGTRIRTISGSKPKALIPAGKQTFIDFQLQWLKILGVTDVVLALGYGADDICAHIEARQSDSAYPQVNYSFDDDGLKVTGSSGAAAPRLLGTGGAVRKASNLLSKDFLVTYGDSFLFLNVLEMVAQHLKSKKALTMSIFKNLNSGDRSNVIYQDGILKKYDKTVQPLEMEHIDYGMSVIQKEYFLENTTDEKFDLATFMTETVSKGDGQGFVAPEIFQEVGSPEGYHRFCEILASHKYDLKDLAKSKGLIK